MLCSRASKAVLGRVEQDRAKQGKAKQGGAVQDGAGQGRAGQGRTSCKTTDHAWGVKLVT